MVGIGTEPVDFAILPVGEPEGARANGKSPPNQH